MVVVNSPLGKYAQLTAVVVVISVIGTWLVMLATANPAAKDVEPFAFAAFGAVLGSAATVNNVKRDTVALHSRLDAAGIPAAPDVSPH